MAEEKPTEFINYDYIKSNSFRVSHADGAFFALTANQGLTISFYCERQPIPRRVVHKVAPDGTLGPEVAEKRIVRDAIIRDVEIAVTMSMDTAKAIRDTLDQTIKTFQKVQSMSYEQVKKEFGNK